MYIKRGVGPVSPLEVDRQICEHFGVPCDPDSWYLNWYHVIGLALACGHTYDSLIATYESYIAEADDHYDHAMLALLKWMKDTYE